MADVRRLPVPVTTVWDWQLRAACRNIDTSVFFHPESERGSAKERRDLRAKQVCARCPVIEACRRHALDVREPYGVWGGMTVAERAAVPEQDTGPLRAADDPTYFEIDVEMLRGCRRLPAARKAVQGL